MKCTLQQLGDFPHFHVEPEDEKRAVTGEGDAGKVRLPAGAEKTPARSRLFKNHLCFWRFFPCRWHWRLIEPLSSRSIQWEVILNITLLFFPPSDFLLLLMFYSDPGCFSETSLATERQLGFLFKNATLIIRCTMVRTIRRPPKSSESNYHHFADHLC